MCMISRVEDGAEKTRCTASLVCPACGLSLILQALQDALQTILVLQTRRMLIQAKGIERKLEKTLVGDQYTVEGVAGP